ncbi:OPA family glycerol-3-phosphate transporter-like MFS transporter [Chitinophaga skermanii]|uniref:OPA family glycerol-3-phosphate transporter-like MFS transporter n=1 Tax=Chitinophaga skermanii TaxID=331697 RepID=A0A327QZ12_9BACT|nr:MFS transporter [Chitinophaga skermanii]RAJ08872.1 OPA family glycerol-3-phosphate transporter-like MFS transporter [Chitinophaga skermanii]
MKNLQTNQWKMLLLTMFCYLFFYTGRHNFGWAAKQLAESLHVSYEKIGWISFAMLVGYAVGQLVHGNFADRFSPRHLITTGGLLSVVANICISFSSSFPVILVLWTLNGYFQSMAWAAGSKIIANWWQGSNRGLAFGMYTMAAGASSIITYLFSIILMNDGWQNIFRIPVIFLAIACIIFFIFVRNKPSDVGLEDNNREGNGTTKPSWQEAYKTVFTNRKFLVVCLSLGFQSMARYGLIFWIPLYFQSRATDEAATHVWISLLLPIGMSIGAISFGFISDKLFNADRIKSILLGMTMCSIVSLSIFFSPTNHPIIISLLVFAAGFFSYGPQANFWPLAPELLGQQYVGTGTGIMNMCAYTFAAIGEPLMGKLIDITGNKAIIFALVSLIALLSAVTIMCMHLVKINTQNKSLQTSI